MNAFSKMVLLSGAAKAVLAHDGHGPADAAAVTGVPNLASIEVGQLLATSCKPITIFTHECQVVTVQPSTTAEVMTTEVTSVATTASPTEAITSSEVIESITTSEEPTEPTAPVTSASCMKQLCMELGIVAFGFAVLLA